MCFSKYNMSYLKVRVFKTDVSDLHLVGQRFVVSGLLSMDVAEEHDVRVDDLDEVLGGSGIPWNLVA